MGAVTNVERHAQTLLALVDADCHRKCEAILAEARSRAAATLRQAHLDARSRMTKAFAEERLRRDARIGGARANLQTRLRLAEQQRAAALLAIGWTRIPQLVRMRWRDADARREWAASIAAAARKTLPATAWRVEHAPDWPAAERDAFAADLARARAVDCTFVADANTRAGLRIIADGNVVDGTLEGLVADRTEIGSRLLRLLDDEEAAAQRSSAGAPTRGVRG